MYNVQGLEMGKKKWNYICNFCSHTRITFFERHHFYARELA